MHDWLWIFIIVLYSIFIAIQLCEIVARRRFRALLDRMIDAIESQLGPTGRLECPTIDGPVAHDCQTGSMSYVFRECGSNGMQRMIFVSADCRSALALPWREQEEL